jgi:hypothetical protein
MKLATKKLGEESVDEAATKLVAKPQYDKARPAFTEPKKKVNEASEQIDELSKKTVNSYYDKIVKQDSGHWSPDDVPTQTDKKRSAGYKMAQRRRRGDVKMSEEAVDEAAVAGTNVAADMDARKAEVQRKIAAKQASFQQAKANKRISGTTMKEAKCSCGEEKGSKMTCEVHGDNKGLKGGKEPIVMNPPLKEASNLPKAVVSKGHEIAKSLIKHRSKVKEPYAVGMAQAKKSANIKD